MKRYFYLILFFCLTACETETAYEKGETFIKFFGTDGMEEGVDFFVDNEGIYLLGNTDNSGNSDLNSSAVLIYTDLDGNEIWSEVLKLGHEDGKEITDKAVGITKLNNGEVVVLINRTEDGIEKGILINVDLNAPSASNYVEIIPTVEVVNKVNFNDIQSTSDNGFIIIGEVRNFENPDSNINDSDWDMIYIKYDQSLNKTLERIRGFGNNSDDFGNSVVEGPNQNYYLFGSVTVEKENPDTGTEFISDVRTVRVNSLLDIVWDKKSSSSLNEYGSKIVNYTNVRYVLGEQKVSEQNTNLIFSELNENGDPLFVRDFGHADINRAGDMVITPDGCFITGAAYENNNYNIVIWKVSHEGDKLWSKSFGFEGEDFGSKIFVQSDGSILVIGTANFGSLSKFCLIKTDKSGNLSIISEEKEM
ncbi:hypothetical protein KMW28_08165 [Flammeovirga yaeyamensis]|uniref:Lipoprotein n=1 Tax=Flammeovirga yaeyamensis TaxID=367791 RepID=A0AAX1N8J7_9BACT|nr:hypothetical protein [Flammeovirga yaeyamensis]MBB3699066.1 hypothetical protein [Flammeovirga yaeyamensis]NMF36500.1 hypothetical protein [Flammeovirga yaeyamensis]QWG03542.1 hypothetical protein KMW28_08165 [Flammeovirga yaeyamensis]